MMIFIIQELEVSAMPVSTIKCIFALSYTAYMTTLEATTSATTLEADVNL